MGEREKRINQYPMIVERDEDRDFQEASIKALSFLFHIKILQ